MTPEPIPWGMFWLDRAPPYEPAPGNFTLGPSADLSVANHRYVAVDDAPQEIRKTHRPAGSVAFSPDGHAIFGNSIFYPLQKACHQPTGHADYFANGGGSDDGGH